MQEILRIYEKARSFMRKNGNMNQWINGYPGEKDILKDMAAGNLYVAESRDGELLCVFAFIKGEEPTYREIDGKWLNDLSYGTIHRIASSGKVSGMLDRCIDFCLKETDNIRIDTHADNIPMQNALRRNGFVRCGVIICSDGTPRVAYQSSRER